MAFKKGNKIAKGGVRPNSGRKPDEVKAMFAQILESSKAYERLERIMRETQSEEIFLKALALTADRAYGKVFQNVEVSGKDGGAIVIEMVDYSKKVDCAKA